MKIIDWFESETFSWKLESNNSCAAPICQNAITLTLRIKMFENYQVILLYAIFLPLSCFNLEWILWLEFVKKWYEEAALFFQNQHTNVLIFASQCLVLFDKIFSIHSSAYAQFVKIYPNYNIQDENFSFKFPNCFCVIHNG